MMKIHVFNHKIKKPLINIGMVYQVTNDFVNRKLWNVALNQSSNFSFLC